MQEMTGLKLPILHQHISIWIYIPVTQSVTNYILDFSLRSMTSFPIANTYAICIYLIFLYILSIYFAILLLLLTDVLSFLCREYRYHHFFTMFSMFFSLLGLNHKYSIFIKIYFLTFEFKEAGQNLIGF